MASFRDIKRQARRDLHRVMQVPALYLVETGADPVTYATPIPVNVRLHYNFGLLGDMKGTNFHYAETQSIKPRIIFMRDELPEPQRLAVVSIEPGEAYRIDNVLPADDITVTVEVVRMSAADTQCIPSPGHDPVCPPPPEPDEDEDE